MYIPTSFDVSDEKTLEAFIERYDFGTVISSSSAGLIASHIPIVLRHSGAVAVLVGHVARANDQWRRFDGSTEALAIFHGPHAYVSRPGMRLRRPYTPGTMPLCTCTESHVRTKTLHSRRRLLSRSLRDTRALGPSHGARKTSRRSCTRSLPLPSLRSKCPSNGSRVNSNLGRIALAKIAMGCSRGSTQNVPRIRTRLQRSSGSTPTSSDGGVEPAAEDGPLR